MIAVCRARVPRCYTPPLVARTKKASANPTGDERGTAPVGTGPSAMDGGIEGGIDEILDGLEAVVHELEAGDLPLEDALRRFEHGVELARRGSTLLDAVEERVEQLLADRDEAVPLTDDDT